MSEYHVQTTKFKDRECLIEGLIAAGYKREDIEVHETAQQLYDYHGQATRYIDKTGDKANVIIRRHRIGYGSANDVGFLFDAATGTYKAIISEYDTGLNHWGPESKRMKALKGGYNDATSIKSAKRQGFKYLGKQIVNGRAELKFLDPRLEA